jgi:hypothetical protein
LLTVTEKCFRHIVSHSKAYLSLVIWIILLKWDVVEK